MPYLCCTHKRRRGREDQYKVKQETEMQFSWDKRDSADTAELIVQNVKAGEVVRREFKGQPAVIENCQDARILLLGHTAAVNIDDCRGCIIVLGPCAGSVFVRDCSSCTVLAVCQQLRTRDCHQMKMAVRCTSEPIIESSNQMNFHPLQLCYTQLKEEMRDAKLNPFTNKAISVHDFTPEKGSSNYRFEGTALELNDEDDRWLSSEGVDCSTESSLFPINSDANHTATMFAYYGKIIEHSPQTYEDTQKKLIEEVESSSNLLLACHFDVDLLDSSLGYQRLAVPTNGYARLCLIGVVGSAPDFSSLLLRNPTFKKVSETAALVASMKETNLISVE